MSCAGRGIVLRQIDRLFREGTLGGLGDGQLLERYLTRRDEAAFETLVDLHGPMVLGLCRRMLRDPRDIEDAFQATFLVLVRKAPAIRDRDLLSSWLYGVAYRVARRARNQTIRRRVRETTVPELVVMAGPESSDRLEVDPVLDQELNRLPEKYRAPLILCYLRGRTHDQAADELRCPVGTVRSRLARGRDLLRRRLTRRGFAPSAMAAILGTGPSLPAKLLVEVVPPSLVSATLKAAFGFGSAQTIQAGAIATSALALAQGVLTTMKFAQLKWLGLAILATSLSAGGVVAVSPAPLQTPRTASDTSSPREQGKSPTKEKSAAKTNRTGMWSVEQAKARLLLAEVDLQQAQVNRNAVAARVEECKAELAAAQSREAAVARAPADIVIPDPFAMEANGSLHGPANGQQDVRMGNLRSDRFDALERKVDELLKRGGANTPTANAPQKEPIPDRPKLESRTNFPATAKPIQELEAQLKQVLLERNYAKRLSEKQGISANEVALYHTKVLVVVGQIEGLDEDLADEIARLKLEMNRKNAERAKAAALEEVAQVFTARNERLNHRKQGMVSTEDVAKAEGETKVAHAQVAIVDAEIAEVGLRIQQLERRRERIKQAMALANEEKTAVSALRK